MPRVDSAPSLARDDVGVSAALHYDGGAPQNLTRASFEFRPQRLRPLGWCNSWPVTLVTGFGPGAPTNVEAAQSMLGHASAAMTLDIYAGSSGMTWTSAALLDATASLARADSLRTGEDLRLAPDTESKGSWTG